MLHCLLLGHLRLELILHLLSHHELHLLLLYTWLKRNKFRLLRLWRGAGSWRNCWLILIAKRVKRSGRLLNRLSCRFGGLVLGLYSLKFKDIHLFGLSVIRFIINCQKFVQISLGFGIWRRLLVVEKVKIYCLLVLISCLSCLLLDWFIWKFEVWLVLDRAIGRILANRLSVVWAQVSKNVTQSTEFGCPLLLFFSCRFSTLFLFSDDIIFNLFIH